MSNRLAKCHRLFPDLIYHINIVECLEKYEHLFPIGTEGVGRVVPDPLNPIIGEENVFYDDHRLLFDKAPLLKQQILQHTKYFFTEELGLTIGSYDQLYMMHSYETHIASGGQCDPHNHHAYGHTFLTAVLCLSDSTKHDCITFYSPRAFTSQPLRTKYTDNDMRAHIPIKKGDLLIWKSDMIHEVRHNHSTHTLSFLCMDFFYDQRLYQQIDSLTVK